MDPSSIDLAHISVSLVSVGGALIVVWTAARKATRIETVAERLEKTVDALRALPEDVAILKTRMGTLENSTSAIATATAKHGSYISQLRERVAKLKGETTGRWHVVPNGNGEDE